MLGKGISVDKKDLIKDFERYSTSHISDAMRGEGSMDRGISPLSQGMKMVGYARVFRIEHGHLYSVYSAVSLVKQGEVLVIAQNGSPEYACTDDAVVLGLSQAGAAGLVVDGALRGKRSSLKTGLPVYARNVSVKISRLSSGQSGVLGTGRAVVGGVFVSDGDIIVADGDGVVVVPKEERLEILKRCEQRGLNVNANQVDGGYRL